MTGKLGSANTVMAAPALRIIRFFQILRMLHVDRHAHSWKLLITVAYMHRIELITTMYMGFVFLIFTAYLIYIAERDFKMPDGHRPFESYADALWFGIVTVATIGYGDKTPHTWPGRIITACLSIIGIAFFALPAGILGSGFALHVQQKERQKLYHKQYPASASLIQAAWRVHATTNLTANNATWRLYKLVDPQLANRSLLISRNIPPLRQRRSIFHNLGNDNDLLNFELFPSTNNNYLFKILIRTDADAATQQLLLGTRQSTAIVDDLPDRFKQAIRVIRQMKFFVARRKFQEVRKPTDMTEIAKQTVEDNQAIMIKLKELQRRLDTTLGGASLDRESTSDAFRKSNRSRSVRFTQQHHQLHIEQQPLTISDQLKGVQDRLTVIEQTLSKFTSIISRIDEKTNARRLTDVI
ncbi:unnamed protein product [Didymodactylos carnosus]|uniref:Uncharacterized protein n=1 Tax=Didymodactylos carnosus TaxID=1234261 RepID=A0A813PH30_9BILA|nr:unnamed protein product [Didymodactylos carnosus]CAF0834013.1 unnamed protein product [Didymodactylos carnosus]CAF3529884.1 unnamed protein product [Didymodactylos carnosus]CAF3618670.1 unnamed protein product [Didymodactylos carnosus]